MVKAYLRDIPYYILFAMIHYEVFQRNRLLSCIHMTLSQNCSNSDLIHLLHFFKICIHFAGKNILQLYRKLAA